MSKYTATVWVKADKAHVYDVDALAEEIRETLEGTSAWHLLWNEDLGDGGLVSGEFEIKVEVRRFVGMLYKVLKSGHHLIPHPMFELLDPLNTDKLRVVGLNVE